MGLSVAIIGLGVMGQRMLTNMAKHPDFTLKVAWDPDQTACAKTASEYAPIEIETSAMAAIERDDVDVIYIASPPVSHRTYAIAAAKAGKVVFCEKPLGVDIADSRSLVEEVEKYGVPNAVNFPFADSAAINLIESRLTNGSIGDVKSVDLRLHFARWPRGWQHSASWLSQRAEGGYVREVGSHYVYLIEKLFGKASLLDASVKYQDDPILCETHFTANLKVAEDIPVSLVGGSGGVGPDRVEFTIWGSKSSMRLYDWVNVQSTTGEQWQEELQHIPDRREDGYVRMLDAFSNLCTGKPNQLPPLRAALSVQEMVEEILARERQ
ncbi:Gfo/Idh/MocA family oxidoreductase [Sneathiella glossodoripedis]|uniref:Gfo/Idh/MocA family oxidoreductase n=1 Tax=Sneathiella glossodoripedis TaxID=418853 RepID=UPI0004715372|nr:Gfo/Idh/MocA family oxidoreductase [Sneathiella glossodoripedis]